MLIVGENTADIVEKSMYEICVASVVAITTSIRELWPANILPLLDNIKSYNKVGASCVLLYLGADAIIREGTKKGLSERLIEGSESLYKKMRDFVIGPKEGRLFIEAEF
jgi:hypothetical protein